MNSWLIGTILLLIALLMSVFGTLRGNTLNRLAFLQLSGTISTLTALLLAEFYGRAAYFDVPLAMAILTYTSILIYLRFLERWL